ncbi:ROK family transcriptional regulator [Streptomyces profundus]|uniref:ROK family transcriptional regulator n=1 Tax=Streptomyces profundus TaxID=2867410 RepID=UPI001D166863|nr:ROK family transcriptional regulator [Streptomyces sp. MA3_2.13]UED86448.1 ROK family transcriptional regulator [Streptomyces sp. MA3_2.13]
MSAVNGPAGGRSGGDAWASVPRAARPILRELVIHGPQSRTALAKRLVLSTGSLTRLTKPLVESGLVVEREVEHDPTHGRPTRPLEIVADTHHFLGVKLTSGALYGVRTDLRGEVVGRESVPLPDLSPDTVVEGAGWLADRLTGDGRRPVAAGVTLGGEVHGAMGDEIIDSGALGWRSVPLRRLLAERLGMPCVVKHDVTALAAAHQWFGDAREEPNFAVIALGNGIGDGIGYALFVHGSAVRSTEADLAEFAHQTLDAGGPMCPEGHRGCVAAYVAADSVRIAAAQGLGRLPGFAEVLRLARAGDPVCAEAVSEAARALGVVIANVANSGLVKTVIVAGASVDIARAARDDLERGILARRRSLGGLRLSVRPHDFGDWARGAAVEAIKAQLAGAA